MERNPTQTQANAERLADIFTTMQRTFVLNLSKELARGQVTFPQYLLLGFLTNQQLTMTEIAARMGHTTAATTGLIDRLEKLGVAKREFDTVDRRKVRVVISKDGLDLVARVRNDMVQNIVNLIGHLTPEEEVYWVQIYEKIFPICQAS
jgi:DNA-binding MarR family transcriptional regulator